MSFCPSWSDIEEDEPPRVGLTLCARITREFESCSICCARSPENVSNVSKVQRTQRDFLVDVSRLVPLLIGHEDKQTSDDKL